MGTVSKHFLVSNSEIRSWKRRIVTSSRIGSGGMSSAATIVFAREDLSIPGAPESALPSADAAQNHFFNLVSDSKPDVVVLDFSAAPPSGSDTILRVRQRCPVPILVICEPGDPMTEEYRIAGAAECIFAPIDIPSLHQSIKRVLGAIGRAMPLENKPGAKLTVDGTSSQMQPKSPVAAVRPS
jgi:DNA-binding NtrC family response regulator